MPEFVCVGKMTKSLSLHSIMNLLIEIPTESEHRGGKNDEGCLTNNVRYELHFSFTRR